jgi:hypothetical protein
MAIGGNLGTLTARRWFFLDERLLLMDEWAEFSEGMAHDERRVRKERRESERNSHSAISAASGFLFMP